MRFRQAIAEALADELDADASVVLIGEDVAAAGGAFKATEGLLDRFGTARVRDTPISETAILGVGVGAAASGLRPVVEMMFVEFIGVALDQLTTEAASFRYLSRGEYGMPLTVRAAAGGGLGFGCQHSQMLDHWFRGTPGITVVVPSTPQDAYGLLRAAIRTDDPVVFLEHKALYADRGEVVRGEQGIIPLGTARTVTSGNDVTIVTVGKMVQTAVDAAQDASWSADIIDLRTIHPFDRDAVAASVKRTGRLVTVEENPLAAGWGGDVVTELAAELWASLVAPPVRITTPPAPVPFAAELEARYLPSPSYVRDQVDGLVATGLAPRPWWTEEAR